MVEPSGERHLEPVGGPQCDDDRAAVGDSFQEPLAERIDEAGTLVPKRTLSAVVSR
jgi:hypothetical protein